MSRHPPTHQIVQLFQQGLALHQQGQLSDAKSIYDSILNVNPRHFDALHLTGVILHQSGQFQVAADFMARAIEINPNNPFAYSNRGNTLSELKKFEAAIASYDKAIALKPDYPEAHYNRGNALSELKKFESAIASYDKAISLKPDYAEAHYNRGNALSELKKFEPAIASYDKAIGLKPDYAEAYRNRGSAHEELRRFDDALLSYKTALSLKPSYEFLVGTVMNTNMQICRWDDLAREIIRFEEDVLAGKVIAEPFISLSLIDKPSLHKIASKIYIDERLKIRQGLGSFKVHPSHEKIRLGYYSADFHNHATSYLMAELFEAHDSSKFELYGFSFGLSPDDEMKERVSAAFNQFIDVSSMTDRDVALLSRELGIDIAVDLKGYTKDNRTGIFAEGCAPIQVNYLGYPGTMGADYIDYIIADKTVIPESSQVDFTEKVVYLPHSYQVNDSKRIISEKVFTKVELGLPQNGFIFCCFNNNYKILPATFEGWMRILKAVEGSVLWLFEGHPTASSNLRKEAEARGVASSRLVFAKQMKLDEHLARHRLADLFIDTLPYNAHTTTSDALWAGLPVLTCMGKSFASRVAASLLNAIEMPELITHTQEDYEARAIELATQPAMLQELKAKLAINRLTTPLFDGQLFAKHIEAAYEAMYARSQAGLPPDHIEILASM